jgi:valyl-tRNA synthetase
MADKYAPRDIEAFWYPIWEQGGLFKPNGDSQSKQVFSMVLPPPNVTGKLHIGHALTVAIQDVLVRYARMKGKTTVWVPGLDHAGIATQTVVERNLTHRFGKEFSRHDLGREKFLEKVWGWKETHGTEIFSQLRRLGASLDWSRALFTMDAVSCEAVNKAFIELFDAGLIKRKKRMVSWCPHLQTVLSDIEVDYTDISPNTSMKLPSGISVSLGKLYKVRYPLQNPTSRINGLDVCTTRPETIFGDVAVAIHSSHPQLGLLQGQMLVHPLVSGKLIPVIVDDVLVNPEFGTGAVKVTPSHDVNDFECGERNNLGHVDVLNLNGTLNENCGTFSGMDRFIARKQVVKKLEELGLLLEVQDHSSRIGLCSRSKDIVEPILMSQWFLDCSEMAKKASKAVRDGSIKLQPDFYKSTWFNFLGKLVCIKRFNLKIIFVIGACQGNYGGVTEFLHLG